MALVVSQPSETGSSGMAGGSSLYFHGLFVSIAFLLFHLSLFMEKYHAVIRKNMLITVLTWGKSVACGEAMSQLQSMHFACRELQIWSLIFLVKGFQLAAVKKDFLLPETMESHCHSWAPNYTFHSSCAMSKYIRRTFWQICVLISLLRTQFSGLWILSLFQNAKQKHPRVQITNSALRIKFHCVIWASSLERRYKFF